MLEVVVMFAFRHPGFIGPMRIMNANTNMAYPASKVPAIIHRSIGIRAGTVVHVRIKRHIDNIIITKAMGLPNIAKYGMSCQITYAYLFRISIVPSEFVITYDRLSGDMNRSVSKATQYSVATTIPPVIAILSVFFME